MPAFTVVFLIALVLMSATRLWLAARQIRHVARHRDAVPAQFAESITLDMHHKAADYTIARTRLAMLEVPVQAALLIALTLLGGLNWINQAWLGVFGPGYAYGVALIASVIVISSVIELPFSLYAQFVVEERFGFNRMTWKLWLADNLKGLAIGTVLGLPLLLAVLWLMDKMGTYWWLYTWIVWMAFMLFVQAIYPNVIAPLYNKFTPLQDEEMRARIEGLLKRCGFASKGLFVMDGSRRSAHGNAYFSGFGATKRIVFFDTLLARLNPPEMEAVLAHELGHFKRHHITKRIAVTFVLSLSLVGIDLTVLSVFGGALGVGLGFGLQKIASNYVSGFIILLERSLKLGDQITVSTYTGIVTQIRTRYTVVRNGDGDTLVPNELMVAQAVQNHNERGTVRVAVRVQASYAADPEVVLALLVQCAEGVPRVLTEPAPAAFMALFADSGIEYELGVWINDPHNGKLGVQSGLNRAIYRRFKEAGIEIPYPQREVRVLGPLALQQGASGDVGAPSVDPSAPA